MSAKACLQQGGVGPRIERLSGDGASMNAIQLTPARRITFACFASIATIALYFYTMTRGIAAGALIGLPSRVTDVVALQREARYGMYAAILLQLSAALIISPLVPPEASDDHRAVRSTLRFVLAALLSVSVTAVVGSMVFAAMIRPQHRFTGYPPSVYMNFFLSCPSDGPCTREDTFRVDPIPRGCCTLVVSNGDGRGTDEVRSYEIFLNGERVVVRADHSQNAQAPLKLRSSNTLKVILTGSPQSKCLPHFHSAIRRGDSLHRSERWSFPLICLHVGGMHHWVNGLHSRLE